MAGLISNCCNFWSYSTLDVTNLSFDLNRNDLEQLFAKYGTVQNLEVPIDRETGHMRGFALVCMEKDAEEDDAIEALDGSEFMGRGLKVNKADPKDPKIFHQGSRRGTLRDFDD
ncbi:MAG: RNA recognition motif domain-containing protein [Cuspidothrix sp.]